MPMNPRLLRPRSTIHPEAADWASRVRANGGSVSGSTLNAVSRFCASIAAAGIRDRFYRLNLFCGTGLTACLVPLYRGQSLGGTQFGNATDANVNFVSGDYAENAGLNSNGTAGATTKYLDTGLSPDGMPTLATGHMSAWKSAGETGVATAGFIGSRTATQFYRLEQTGSTNVPRGNWGHGITATAASGDTTAGLLTLTRDSSGATIYKNTTSIATDAARTPSANSNAFVVFNSRNTDGTVGAAGWIRAIYSYSIGGALTSTQVSSYHSALSTFHSALGRS